MTGSPLVSIIINNYNYGRFLREAIESALAQTYPNVEVIVVDDGSTDNSREIIASYGDRVIPVLKENGGQGSALNAGFKASSGDLVLFLDSDDMLEPEAIETVVREWRDGMSRSYFLLQVVNEKGEPCGGTVGGLTLPSPMSGPFSSGSSTTGNVLSRLALEKVMPIPEVEEWRIGPDFYVSATTSIFGEARCLGRVLGKYRIHGSNNGVCSGTLYRAKRRPRIDLSLYSALYRLTDGRMISLDAWLGASPTHWICRIKWLRESPQDYPWHDTPTELTIRAVKAVWREPGRNFFHRLAYTVYAEAYGLLPRKLTRVAGKIAPMWRIVALRSCREESEILARAAEHGQYGA